MSKSKHGYFETLSNNWTFLCLFSFAVLTIIASSAWFLYQSYARLITFGSQQQARLLTTALQEARTIYTQDVVEAAKKNGLKVTHDFKNHDGALPLPATMSMKLGNRIGNLTGGASSTLFSPYPFFGRDGGGLKDAFRQEAWQALSQTPEQPYFRFEETENDKVLRYATADLMRAACVDCHNSHPSSPKTDWQAGDLRGILEVIIPIKHIEAIAHKDFFDALQTISLFSFLSLFIVSGIYIRSRHVASKIEQANKQLSTYDSLTGLYNRRMLMNHVQHAIALAERHQQNFGLLYFDLDDFKKINDTFGHTVGDRLLQEFSQKVSEHIRETDIFARMGGDEFVLLITDTSETFYLMQLAKKIMQTFSAGFYIEKLPVYVTSSIGIAVYPESGTTPEEIIKNADRAMYQAKEAGRNCYMFYSEEMNEMASAQLAMENDIRNALKNDEFTLHYQPKMNRSGKVNGAEALIRWIHPEKGLISPDKFIPIAEKSDLIIEIGQWVREQACRQLLEWKENNFPPIKISVNVAAKEFTKHVVLQNLIDLFLKYDIDQHLLELEITEGTLMSSVDNGNMDYKVIKGMNVGLSIDDFGTGYCSLGYLKSYPIDTLKIDKSFIDNVTTNECDASITKTIIAMAHSLNMKVVAEGVETQAQHEFLLAHDCDQIQGYYCNRPQEINDFEAFVLSANNSSVNMAVEESV
ncbi:EAL domain-containing protein [Thalassomonas viridans]|uniref:EAL domain-containing protein n=1 Tax=Thalassomonas viridans TaxID=137584 RepID=A0AAE9YXL8_9GAMM|nr:EAL domain-containing protein [Thalassomonas viridans]WDE03096.1 EAL domain-containing protein [Thalassomonas viridans]